MNLANNISVAAAPKKPLMDSHSHETARTRIFVFD